MNPPQALWGDTGTQADGTSVASMEVRICRDAQGMIWSVHQARGPADRAVFESWPGQGVRAIAHALMVEALRREAYMCVLTHLTKDPDMVTRYINGDPSIRSDMEMAMTAAVRDSLESTLPRMIPNTVKEILAMVSEQGMKTTPIA